MRTFTTAHSNTPAICFASLGVSVLLIVSPLTMADDPEVIYLTGKVIDFQKSHPDFNIDSATGHVAHNSALLASANRPEFTGTGFEVATQWKNIANQNIAPHLSLYGFGAGGVIPVVNDSEPPTGGLSEFDSYDSTLGPYGVDGNVGPAPVFEDGAQMPPLGVPEWLAALPNQGNVNYTGTNTISENMHVDEMRVSGTLYISGDVNILCEGKFRLNTQAHVLLEDGATLNLYLIDGAGEIAGADSWNHVVVGDELNPHRVRFYNLSENEVMIHNHAQVFAIIFSPNAQLTLTNHGELFGLFAGQEMVFGTHGKFHLDEGSKPHLCEEILSDTLGAEGSENEGQITSVASFHEWYSDVLGVNMSNRHTIPLTRNETGIYEYLDDSFFPIDDQLLGNEGDDHNYNFTFMFTASFEHNQCEGGFFEFTGADDVWVYIDGGLAMDLGGIMPLTPQVIEMDRLGLEDGETYKLHFFYAQRNPHVSVFRVRTNVELETDSFMTVTAKFD